MRYPSLNTWATWTCPHAATVAALHSAYSHLSTTLDDQVFQQAASHLLDTLHATLHTNDLPPDLVLLCWQLERATREQIRQRHLLPSRPLF